MRSLRFSVAVLMGVVLAACLALGLSRLRSPGEWAGALFLATCGVLALAIVGCVSRGGRERTWWLGFALFGWGYLSLAVWKDTRSNTELPRLPSIGASAALRSALGVFPPFKEQNDAFELVCLCLWALAAAMIGGPLAWGFFGRRSSDADLSRGGPQMEARSIASAWRALAVIAVACSIVAALILLIGMRWAPGLWAAGALVTVWGFLCLAAVGAACNRGIRRARWLGAALFGSVSMTLIFGCDGPPGSWSGIAPSQLLLDLRPWIPNDFEETPTHSGGFDAAHVRIRRVLSQPAPVRFHDEIPLEDVVRYLRREARDPVTNRPGITVCFDPVGLSEEDRTMLPLRFNRKGVPLGESLRHALAMDGHRYYLRDGMLNIASSHERFVHAIDHPFLVVGNCFLALLLAALGGLLAPLVCDQAKVLSHSTRRGTTTNNPFPESGSNPPPSR
jgi:hypothetical protein